MNQEIVLSPATPIDLSTVKHLLSSSSLPSADIDIHISNFITAKTDNRIIGVIGLEVYETSGLLRSFAVTPEFRCRGIGELLIQSLLGVCRKMNIRSLYLLTTTASVYFSKHHFAPVNRAVLPPEIRQTEEFRTICPASATCMFLCLD